MFQLTTSRRGRRVAFSARWIFVSVSTHDLTKRSTANALAWYYRDSGFNSRPHEEVDYMALLLLISSVVFQLTTSRRGRPGYDSQVAKSQGVSTHDLTKRSTYLSILEDFSLKVSTHDLTKRSTVV